MVTLVFCKRCFIIINIIIKENSSALQGRQQCSLTLHFGFQAVSPPPCQPFTAPSCSFLSVILFTMLYYTCLPNLLQLWNRGNALASKWETLKKIQQVLCSWNRRWKEELEWNAVSFRDTQMVCTCFYLHYTCVHICLNIVFTSSSFQFREFTFCVWRVEVEKIINS